MGIGSLIFLAVGLSMDACAVSICKGLAMKKAGIREGAICGAWFGGFQGLMPLIGYFLGSAFSDYINAYDHWIAFGLLLFIGIGMLKEAFSMEDPCEACQENGGDLSFKTMLIMAIATSVDALAVGISLAMAGDVNIFMAIALIGATTFGFSCAGVKIGNIFGSRFEKKAQAAGGLILIGMGIKILMEHHFWEIFL